MPGDRDPSSSADIFLDAKFDRLAVIVGVVAYLGLVVVLILSLAGVLPDYDVRFGRRHTIFVISDDVLLTIFTALPALGVVMWRKRVVEYLRKIFRREEQP